MKIFTEEEIIKIYNEKVKKNQDYFNKPLPKKCPTKKWNFCWKGKDAPRCFCIRDFKDWVEKYGINKCKNLGYTSLDDPELDFIETEKSFFYPYLVDNNLMVKNDLHTFLTEEKHDFFIFNQTLEHVYNPYLAVENIAKNIIQGGYVFTSVPTINIPHQTPFNFSGWYPMGLAVLFVSAGFEIIETGQWGNNNYINHIFKHHEWPDVYSVGETNEERNVAQCWILAKKL